MYAQIKNDPVILKISTHRFIEKEIDLDQNVGGKSFVYHGFIPGNQMEMIEIEIKWDL